jgi:type I restriction enzyme S subunit
MSWPLQKLGDVAERVTVGHVGPTSKYYTENGIPLLRTQNVGSQKLEMEDVKTITPEFHALLKKSQLKTGDIVISRVISSEIRCAVVPPEFDGANCANIIAVRPGTELDSSYLVHYLTSPLVQHELMKLKVGSAQSVVNTGVIKKWEVPLPPLPEQKRIAAILDKADEIRRKRAETIRLTEELLKSAFLEMFGDPVTNPKGWEVKKLGEVCSFVGGGTPARARPEFFTGDIPWATSKDIRGEVFVDGQEHITEDAIANSSTKLVSAGTLLIVVKSKVLMHRLPVTISTVPVCFGQDLKGIVLEHADLRPEYVLRLLKLSSAVLLPQARGANTEGLTLDHLRSLAIFWPPKDRILKYQALSSRVRRILGKDSLPQADDLLGALTQRAFQGKL